MDIGPYVALIALIIGIPYMVWQRQWALTAYFVLTAVAVAARTFFGAGQVAGGLTWLSMAPLAVGIYQLLKRRRVVS